MNENYEEYYRWLISLISPPPTLTTYIHRYGMLLFELWRREFAWFDAYEGEESRAMDGKTLRDQFIMDFDRTPDAVPQGPCTVLEMLIAFALRIDTQVHDWRLGNRPWEWIEMFIDNLGLGELVDCHINPVRDAGYINARLETWMAHDIGRKGEGGLFRFKKPLLTIGNLDNWAQMNRWIIENF